MKVHTMQTHSKTLEVLNKVLISCGIIRKFYYHFYQLSHGQNMVHTHTHIHTHTRAYCYICEYMCFLIKDNFALNRLCIFSTRKFTLSISTLETTAAAGMRL